MFNLHGGGFLLGKKEEGHLFCAEMSQRGFLVFSKQRNYPKPATVISGHSLWRYSSKLQQTVCKSDKKAGVICHLEDYEVDKKLPHAFSTTFPEMEESKRANTQMVEFLFKY